MHLLFCTRLLQRSLWNHLESGYSSNLICYFVAPRKASFTQKFATPSNFQISINSSLSNTRSLVFYNFRSTVSSLDVMFQFARERIKEFFLL